MGPVAVRIALLSSLLLACISPLQAAGEVTLDASNHEVLVYRWRIEGVQRFLARLFDLVPTKGDGYLTTRVDSEGRLMHEFKATSEQAGASDHWTYQTLVDPEAAKTLRVQETYRYRNKRREKTFELQQRQVIDVLSGLHLLRRSPAEELQRTTIWSGGKVYPVAVMVNRSSMRTVGDREVRVRHLMIRGIREPGQRRWRGQAEVWLTEDRRALPVELLYRQRFGRVRLILAESALPDASDPPGR